MLGLGRRRDLHLTKAQCIAIAVVMAAGMLLFTADLAHGDEHYYDFVVSLLTSLELFRKLILGRHELIDS